MGLDANFDQTSDVMVNGDGWVFTFCCFCCPV